MPRSFTTPKGQTLETVRKLGAGQFGTAIQVKSQKGIFYCLKEIKVHTKKEEDKAQAIQEMQMMKACCNHPNIVAYHDAWFPDKWSMCILMEFAPNGALDGLIDERVKTGEHFHPHKIMHFMQELASALQYCHDDLGIMHRDIKPANILLDRLGTLKLADFGLSKSLGGSNLASTVCGSPLYMSPELCSGTPYSYKADVWSFGCVMYELMELRSPWMDATVQGPQAYAMLIRRITEGDANYEPLRERYGERLAGTTRWMLMRNVACRATASQVLSLLEMRDPPKNPTFIPPRQETAPAYYSRRQPVQQQVPVQQQTPMQAPVQAPVQQFPTGAPRYLPAFVDYFEKQSPQQAQAQPYATPTPISTDIPQAGRLPPIDVSEPFHAQEKVEAAQQNYESPASAAYRKYPHPPSNPPPDGGIAVRQRRLVEDARRIAAAQAIQRSFRASVGERPRSNVRRPTAVPAAAPMAAPVPYGQNYAQAHQRARRRQQVEAIAATALIQRQMRKSLNRRREGPAPRATSKGNPPAAGMCSDRLSRLATPRARRDPVSLNATPKRPAPTLPVVPSAARIPITRPQGVPRNAWA